MAVYSTITKNELLDFIANYKIGSLLKFEGILEGIENTNYKIITSNNTYILTIFEKRVRSEDLPFFINLQNHLTNKKFICPKPIKNKHGEQINILKNKSCVLVSFLKGSKIEIPTQSHCKQVGEKLALLHHETKDFKQTRNNNMDYDQWKNI